MTTANTRTAASPHPLTAMRLWLHAAERRRPDVHERNAHMTYDAALEAVMITASEGGGTFYADSCVAVPIDAGYVVSLGGGAILASCDVTADRMRLAAKLVGEEFMSPLVGTWLHDSDVYITAVEVIADRVEAIVTGIQRKQYGIFDAANNETIML